MLKLMLVLVTISGLGGCAFWRKLPMPDSEARINRLNEQAKTRVLWENKHLKREQVSAVEIVE